MVQLPIGIEDQLSGVVDLLEMKAYFNEGDSGETIRADAIPADMADLAASKRLELIEAIADVDDELGEIFLEDGEITADLLRAAIRRATIGLEFVPVFCGSAFKNKGVQPLLDGVVHYLPSPDEVTNTGLDLNDNEKPVELTSDPKAPLVALAFKLEESRFGQLTYMRIYQGTLEKASTIINSVNRKKVKVPRVVRMHSAEMEDIQEAPAGEIVAMFGVDCATGDTFTDGKTRIAMTSMFVPDAVISLSIAPEDRSAAQNFSKALGRFSKEDPTFRVSVDKDSGETIISGMGELHLFIYVERMKREYNVPCVTGQPQVQYREAITKRAEFNYTHKKQSGGAGQYGRVQGYIEPLAEDAEDPTAFEFVNHLVGNAIPPGFIPAVERGFKESSEKGPLLDMPVNGVRVVLQDGLAHAVDSSEMSFRLAAQGAFRQAFETAGAIITEPVMDVDIEAPVEFQGDVISGVNQRKGLITDTAGEDAYVRIKADVPLANMFGYSTVLRSSTQGKGEFSMEYREHRPVTRDVQEELISEHIKAKAAARKEK